MSGSKCGLTRATPTVVLTSSRAMEGPILSSIDIRRINRGLPKNGQKVDSDNEVAAQWLSSGEVPALSLSHRNAVTL